MLRRLGRLAFVVLVIASTALALAVYAHNAPGHAAPAPATPSIAILPPTTLPTAAPAGLGSEGYVPTPAGPPATDRTGLWMPVPDPAPAPASSSSGGGR
jgi:hypothetical protein